MLQVSGSGIFFFKIYVGHVTVCRGTEQSLSIIKERLLLLCRKSMDKIAERKKRKEP